MGVVGSDQIWTLWSDCDVFWQFLRVWLGVENYLLNKKTRAGVCVCVCVCVCVVRAVGAARVHISAIFTSRVIHITFVMQSNLWFGNITSALNVMSEPHSVQLCT